VQMSSMQSKFKQYIVFSYFCLHGIVTHDCICSLIVHCPLAHSRAHSLSVRRSEARAPCRRLRPRCPPRTLPGGCVTDPWVQPMGASNPPIWYSIHLVFYTVLYGTATFVAYRTNTNKRHSVVQLNTSPQPLPHHGPPCPTTHAPRTRHARATHHNAPPRTTTRHGRPRYLHSLFQGDEWGREEEDAHRISVKKFFHQVGWCDKSASNQAPG
jgi:hypothetical protein